jgi:hypothetical protein
MVSKALYISFSLGGVNLQSGENIVELVQEARTLALLTDARGIKVCTDVRGDELAMVVKSFATAVIVCNCWPDPWACAMEP